MITPMNKKELLEIINSRPESASLNDISISFIPNLENVFTDTNFNGDISKWDFSTFPYSTQTHKWFVGSKFTGRNCTWSAENCSLLLRLNMEFGFNLKGGIVSHFATITNTGNMLVMDILANRKNKDPFFSEEVLKLKAKCGLTVKDFQQILMSYDSAALDAKVLLGALNRVYKRVRQLTPLQIGAAVAALYSFSVIVTEDDVVEVLLNKVIEKQQHARGISSRKWEFFLRGQDELWEAYKENLKSSAKRRLEMAIYHRRVKERIEREEMELKSKLKKGAELNRIAQKNYSKFGFKKLSVGDKGVASGRIAVTPYTKKDLGISDSEITNVFTVGKNTVEFVQRKNDRTDNIMVFINNHKVVVPSVFDTRDWSYIVQSHKRSGVNIYINDAGVLGMTSLDYTADYDYDEDVTEYDFYEELRNQLDDDLDEVEPRIHTVLNLYELEI